MRILFIALLFGLALPLPTVTPVSAAEPAEVKSAFIINFARFTLWPDSGGDRIQICFPTVAEPVGAAMDKLHGNSRIGKRNLEVRRGVDQDELHICSLVYLSNRDAYRRNEILIELEDAPVLTVSDLSGFLDAGGMIELFAEGGKYRFAVNKNGITRANLHIDARILGLARKREAQP